MANERPRLTLDPVRYADRCPVHPSHQLALVGETPAPEDRPALHAALGVTEEEFHSIYARAALFDRLVEPSFPLGAARSAAEALCQRLAPRPLILLGRAVAMAFAFPNQKVLEWEHYQLGTTWCYAMVVPSPEHLTPDQLVGPVSCAFAWN